MPYTMTAKVTVCKIEDCPFRYWDEHMGWYYCQHPKRDEHYGRCTSQERGDTPLTCDCPLRSWRVEVHA